jgi:hypothetical protein
VARKKDPASGVDAELVGRLVEQPHAAGRPLTGDGVLLQQLTKRVIEAALDGEITIISAMTRATGRQQRAELPQRCPRQEN